MAEGEPLKISWTQTAEEQLFSILEYWTKRNHSTQFAEKLYNLTSERTKQISSAPFSARKTTFPNTRVAAMGHFSIYYQVASSSIIIVAFWDNRQNPKKLIKILKKN